jgi:integrase
MKIIKLVDAILDAHAYERVDGNVAADGTATQRGNAVRSAFRLLNAKGYKLEDPRNLSEKHIKVLCQAWKENGLTPKSMNVYLSSLRIFSTWIGKAGLVKDLPYYLPDVPKKELRAKTIATDSKSWAATGVDVCQKIMDADALDWRFGLMVRLQVAFGLRRIEVLRLQIWKVHHGDKLAVKYTKGGRPRDIYIDTDEQRNVVALVKSKIKGKDEHLGWKERKDGKPFERSVKDASLKYSQGLYNRYMAKLGITKEMSKCTGHGLRAQFAENAALLKNLIPATLGGTGGQMPRGDIEVTRLQVSESLGHSRLSVTGAYFGSFGRDTTPDAPDRAAKVITAGLDMIDITSMGKIPAERLTDCMKLSNDLIQAHIYGADVRKIEALWRAHSRRHATEWVEPSEASNLAALEVAARFIISANSHSPDSDPVAG